jgi:hypothetical protein
MAERLAMGGLARSEVSGRLGIEADATTYAAMSSSEATLVGAVAPAEADSTETHCDMAEVACPAWPAEGGSPAGGCGGGGREDAGTAGAIAVAGAAAAVSSEAAVVAATRRRRPSTTARRRASS